MADSTSSDRGLNILCIDGGGARGLSALILLEEIMKRIQHLQNLDSPPKPHECFDLIAGAGTGAVQACMIGRLRMSVDSAIQAYAKMAKGVFSEKKRFGSGSFKTTKLKQSLREMINEAIGNPDESIMDKERSGRCKTLVFAMSSHNMRGTTPTSFRSYPVAANEGPQCTIWETLCATMAHPDLFKPFVIGHPPLGQSFVDAGLGCNNPLVHVLAEVKTLYPNQHVASVTSIGTGHTRTIQIPDSILSRHLLPIAAIVTTKNIAADTEGIAEEMARRFSSAMDVYFRLNVDQGLQSVGMDEWEQLGEVLEHTRAYMRLVDVNQRIGKAVQAIHSMRTNAPIVQIDGEIQVEVAATRLLSTIRRCPAPTPTFTGCELKISRIESCVCGSTAERKVCVVHGLGGAGKTQMVLKVVERTYDQWKEVIYVDASTQESIESALKNVAATKKVGDGYEDTLLWLESCREQWLVVFDNADDPSLPLRNYFPRGNRGSIIITTRLSGMVSLAQGPYSNCTVSSMNPDDSLTLFLKLARKQDQELPFEEAESARVLLQNFGYFALAITHTGSFIGQSPHMSFVRYRSLFLGQQQRALEAYSKLPEAAKADGYRYTVYTAWLMCYESLSARARELFWLIGYLHHTGITTDIFQRSTTNITSYEPKFPTTPLEESARHKPRELLGFFMDTNQYWDDLSFTETINEIVSRSLLEYDNLNQSYRVHALVQSWVRTVVPWENDLAIDCIRTLLSVSAPFGDSLESVIYRMKIGPHIDKVLSETVYEGKIGVNHALAFAEVYGDRGHWRRAEEFRVQIWKVNANELGDDHPSTLLAMGNLAYTYSDLNRHEEARDLKVQVLAARKRVLGDDHPDTLKSMNNLAFTYLDLGLWEQAAQLNINLSIFIRTFGQDHETTCTARYLLQEIENCRENHADS